MGTVHTFPIKRRYRPWPDNVRVGFDFGAWCVELRSGDRLLRRAAAVSEDAARCEAKRLAATGLRLLPDAPLPVTYHGPDNGDDCA